MRDYLELIKNWANQNEGFLTLVFGFIGLGLFGELVKYCRKKWLSWKVGESIKGGMLNPHIQIYECDSHYIQTQKFKYEHVFKFKIKAKNNEINMFCVKYDWDGSEDEYSYNAYEILDDGAKKIKLNMTEAKPREDGNARVFAIVFRQAGVDSWKKREILISFEKLSDKKNQARPTSAVVPLNDGYNVLVMRVTLKTKEIFKKRLDQLRLQSYVIGSEIRFVAEPVRDVNWPVYDERDQPGKITANQRYCILWK